MDPPPGKPAAHKIYPYLLRGLAIEGVNQVWCSDVTYIPMAKGFLYLVVIMDWVSRAVLTFDSRVAAQNSRRPGLPDRANRDAGGTRGRPASRAAACDGQPAPRRSRNLAARCATVRTSTSIGSTLIFVSATCTTPSTIA